MRMMPKPPCHQAGPGLPEQGATDAQKVAAWMPLIAQTGTYEVKESTVTTRISVAKSPAAMAPGNFTTQEFKIEGNTLTLTPKTDQNGPIANPTVVKYARAE